MTLIETIGNALENGVSSLEIRYGCKTAFPNAAFVDAYINDKLVYTDHGELPLRFVKDLEEAIAKLNSTSYPYLHLIRKRVELHHSYPGFNSVGYSELPITISNNDESKEIKKTGQVSFKCSQVGKEKVLEIIAEHPDYELYERWGFAFRGAMEHQTTLEELKKDLDAMCVADVKVIDNEIHVNCFSGGDMW